MEFLRELRVVEEARKMEPGSLIQIIRTCLPYSVSSVHISIVFLVTEAIDYSHFI